MSVYINWLNSDQSLDLKPGCACLIQINDQNLAQAFLRRLVGSKPHLVSFAEPESERWHDMLDTMLLDENETAVLTTWHTAEPIGDVVDEFYEVDVPYMCDEPSVFVIEVGRGNLIETAQIKGSR